MEFWFLFNYLYIFFKVSCLCWAQWFDILDSKIHLKIKILWSFKETCVSGTKIKYCTLLSCHVSVAFITSLELLKTGGKTCYTVKRVYANEFHHICKYLRTLNQLLLISWCMVTLPGNFGSLLESKKLSTSSKLLALLLLWFPKGPKCHHAPNRVQKLFW